jgi:uncharacterized protein
MRKGWILSVLVYAALQAHAASFDCAKANTPQEKAICASPSLSATDGKMAAAYQALLKQLPTEFREDVRENQRDWLHRLPHVCNEETTRSTIEYCLGQEYSMRISTLNGSLKRVGGVTFFYRHVLREAKDHRAYTNGDYQAHPPLRWVTLTLSWPIAFSDAPEWKAWNAMIESAIIGGMGVDGLRFEWNGDDSGDGGDVDAGAEVGFVNGQLVATTVVASWGRHPEINHYNWMLREHRPLQNEDVFKAGTGWAALLESITEKQLREQVNESLFAADDEKGETAKALLKFVTQPAQWEFGKAGLSIDCYGYSAFPAIMPVPTVTISWARLKPYLNPAFKIPR